MCSHVESLGLTSTIGFQSSSRNNPLVACRKQSLSTTGQGLQAKKNLRKHPSSARLGPSPSDQCPLGHRESLKAYGSGPLLDSSESTMKFYCPHQSHCTPTPPPYIFPCESPTFSLLHCANIYGTQCHAGAAQVLGKTFPSQVPVASPRGQQKCTNNQKDTNREEGRGQVMARRRIWPCWPEAFGGL